MLPGQLGSLFPMDMMPYSNYAMLALATPLQFWIGWRFYMGLWDGIKAKASNMDTLIAIGTTAAYLYSAIVTISPGISHLNQCILKLSNYHHLDINWKIA